MSPRSIVVRFLLSVAVCILACAVFASELPEQITLTNDTSNDYIVGRPSVLKQVQVSTFAKLRVTSEDVPQSPDALQFRGSGREMTPMVPRSFSFQTVLRT